VDETAAGLGRDAAAYRRLLAPLVRTPASPCPTSWRRSGSVPSHRSRWSGSAWAALAAASLLARRFRTPEAQALLAGAAAHAMLPLTAPVTGAFGLVLMITAHSWAGR